MCKLTHELRVDGSAGVALRSAARRADSLRLGGCCRVRGGLWRAAGLAAPLRPRPLLRASPLRRPLPLGSRARAAAGAGDRLPLAAARDPPAADVPPRRRRGRPSGRRAGAAGRMAADAAAAADAARRAFARGAVVARGRPSPCAASDVGRLPGRAAARAHACRRGGLRGGTGLWLSSQLAGGESRKKTVQFSKAKTPAYALPSH
mmetsp:Transcript_39874/g.131912  ORF Transcript_39874/g.131912 Transcript_39874/m.131912 type:complete len:205 (-) Transcript_39874:1127-1741(-)